MEGYDHTQKYHFLASLIERFSFFFFWLKWFYPKSQGIPLAFQLYFFVPQKLFRINGSVPWPAHFTSRILFHRNIEVGNWCAPGMNSCCYIQARNGIRIGHNFRMGPGSGLISANHDPNNYDLHLPSKPITIGNNVWLGMNVVILPGVRIGDNVIIGANSVVKSDIPSNSIATGNPCIVVKEKLPYEGIDYTRT